MKKIGICATLFFLLAWLGVAEAGMSEFISYTDNGAGISVDAKGLDTNTDGTIRANIPAGSSVVAAYLYSASVWNSGLSDVVFNGTTLNSTGSSRVDKGAKDGNPASENRWDVTSIVQTVVGSNSGLFNFTLRETGYLDGEVLAVLYKDASKPVNTAIIYDGELATTGDSFKIALGTPVDKTNPNFFATMSLGISFGFQPAGQYSQVDVNGSRLTTSAGGQDDGFGQDGGLITAGGIGDSTANPDHPFWTDLDAANPTLGNLGSNAFRYDDELYSLNDFLTNGDTLININTLNPSNDDNVFFMAFSTLGVAQVITAPEPTTLLLLGIGLFGLAAFRRRRRG